MKAELIAKIIGNTAKTIFLWRKEQRPIIKLLDKYFSDSDLKEFLDSGSISSLDQVKTYQTISSYYINYFIDYLVSFDTKTDLNLNHPIYIILDFLDYYSFDNSSKDINLIENSYIRWVINSKVDVFLIKKMLNIDMFILVNIANGSISKKDIFNNKLLLKYMFFYNNSKEIENINLDFFVENFNLASHDYFKFQNILNKYLKDNKDIEKITILKNINDIMTKLNN